MRALLLAVWIRPLTCGNSHIYIYIVYLVSAVYKWDLLWATWNARLPELCYFLAAAPPCSRIFRNRMIFIRHSAIIACVCEAVRGVTTTCAVGEPNATQGVQIHAYGGMRAVESHIYGRFGTFSLNNDVSEPSGLWNLLPQC